MSGGVKSEKSENVKASGSNSIISIHYIICECGETFPTENDLKLHLEKEHPHKKERKEYKCGICGSIYDSEVACIGHYERNHIKKEPKRERPDSDEEFEGDGLLAVPGEEPEESQEETLPSLTEEQLLSLLSNSSTLGKISTNRIRKKPPKTIVCEVCGRKYASNAALKYHQRVHTGERPYQCTMCPKTFTMPLFLQIHTRTHTGERPFVCGECPKRFSNRAALLRHERVHSGIKPYPCPMCDKYFTQSNSMKLHVTTVHLKQPAPYKSKNRKLKAEQRSQPSKLPPRITKAQPVSSLEVLQNGLEDYVLGPLKNDVEALKNECGDLSVINKMDAENEVTSEIVESEVMYDGEDRECYVVYQ